MILSDFLKWLSRRKLLRLETLVRNIITGKSRLNLWRRLPESKMWDENAFTRENWFSLGIYSRYQVASFLRYSFHRRFQVLLCRFCRYFQLFVSEKENFVRLQQSISILEQPNIEVVTGGWNWRVEIPQIKFLDWVQPQILPREKVILNNTILNWDSLSKISADLCFEIALQTNWKQHLQNKYSSFCRSYKGLAVLKWLRTAAVKYHLMNSRRW